MNQEWIISASLFADSARVFLNEFSTSLRTSRPFPIARLFQLFPLNPSNLDTSRRLVARGDLVVAAGEVKNTGPFVDATFDDDNMGLVGIFFPENLRATFQLTASQVSLLVVGDEVVVSLYDLPPDLGTANRFLFKGCALEVQRFTYALVEDGAPQNQLLIVTDFTQAIPSPTSGNIDEMSAELKVRTLGMILSRAGTEPVCPYSAPSDAKWYVCRDGQGYCRIAKGGCSIWGTQRSGPYDTAEEAQAAMNADSGCAREN